VAITINHLEMKKLSVVALAILAMLSCKKEMLNVNSQPPVENDSHYYKTDGGGQYAYYQKWDGDLDEPCYALGFDCVTIVWDDDLPTKKHNMDNAIAQGGSALADYLYSEEGITEWPFDDARRDSLANGTLTFYPMDDLANNTAYYRFK
jgi:hypothetical protein